MNGLLHDIPDTWSAGLKGEESHIGAVFLYSGVPPPAGGLAPPVPDRPAMTMSPDLPPARTHTTTALLAALHDLSDQPAWREFEGRYAPIISGVARRMGLSESDSQDVMQETMLQFIRDYRAGKYDRTRGRLRSWIIGIARHRIADIFEQGFVVGVEAERAVAVIDDDDQAVAGHPFGENDVAIGDGAHRATETGGDQQPVAAAAIGHAPAE